MNPNLKGTIVSKSASVVLIIISSLSLITSGATLAAMLFGAKKVVTEVEAVKTQANDKIDKIKNALQDI